MTGKKCPWGTYSAENGIEGLNDRLRKAKRLKPFPTYRDAEQEVKQVPKAWGYKKQ